MSFLFEQKDFQQYSRFRGECALDIPQLFRDLISESEQVRQVARESVYQWPEEMLRDFGQIEAIPEFLECLLDLGFQPTAPQSAQLLSLSAELVLGLPNFLTYPQYYGSTPLELATATWQQFAGYADRFRQVVGAPDPDTRRAAMQCLMVLRQSGDEAIIHQQLHVEEEPVVIAAALEALSNFPAAIDLQLVRRLADSHDDQIKCRALQSLARSDGSYPNEATKRLAALVVGTQPEAAQLAKEIVNNLGANALLGCVLIWIGDMQRMPPEKLGRLVLSAITTTFRPMNYSRTQLSTAERLLLTAVSASSTFWANAGSDAFREVTTYLATALHLPSTQDALYDRVTNERAYIRED